MSEVLTAAAEAPQTDALAETTELPKPVEAKLPEAEPKPEVKKNPDQQRSDAVKNAIDKALKPEEAKPAKADAKPEAEIKPEPVAKDRAADGKFAAPVAAEPKPEPKPTAFRDAPPRFDDAAKSEWEAVPEGTRGAIHRTVRELEQGITKHREAAEAFEPIRKYADMAKQSGTDLATALQRFTGMEQELRRNPIAGLQAVVANLGIKNPQTGMPVTLRDIAAHVLGQKPDQVASQHEASNQQLRQQVAQLQQQISGVTQHVQSQQQEARVASVASEWDGFKASNPRATELEPYMAEFLQKYPAPANMPVRERLADAYAFAAAKFPSPTGAHTADQLAPLAQTQAQPKPINPAGQKSVSGAPSGKAEVATRKLSRKEAINKAMSQIGL
jgi:hypothetical protein